jgi:hypothetical protein
MKNWRELKDGTRHARCWGWEAQANNESIAEYRESIAGKYGRESWSEMTAEEKQEATREFQNGREEEKANS